MAAARDPAADLRHIAFLLERTREPTYRVRAFRTAAATVADLSDADLAERAEAGTLRKLTGIGAKTEQCILESLRGEVPGYLARLQAVEVPELDPAAAAVRATLRGDLHSHSDWSDGGSPIPEMAETARLLGHEYLSTRRSPRSSAAPSRHSPSRRPSTTSSASASTRSN